MSFLIHSVHVSYKSNYSSVLLVAQLNSFSQSQLNIFTVPGNWAEYSGSRTLGWHKPFPLKGKSIR